MANYRQWLWDGEWHDYPKGKEPMKIELLPSFNPSPFPNDLVSIDGLDYLKYQMLKYFDLSKLIKGDTDGK